MAQCDLCYKDDDNITKEMLKNEGIDNTDDYFLSYNEITVCKDCYYKRDKWDKESIDDTDGIYARKHTCELCKTQHHLDNGFLDISDICEDHEDSVEKYEEKHNVSFSDFWCVPCTDKTIKEIERTAT
jgi:ribosome-binding protein aMBF1 (putative translation factor)